MERLRFQLKIVLFLILSLALAGGLVFAGYKLGQRQAFPDVQPSFKITPDQAIEMAKNAIPGSGEVLEITELTILP